MNYIQTYIERDVRSIRSVTDLAQFQKFLALCAGRVGQLLNLNGLAGECGISHNTARDWMSVVEASYLTFRLQPYHENFNKRIVKQPKLYFLDTGLLCALLDLRKPNQLGNHYLRGQIFESFVVSELVKRLWESGASGNGYFWRDRYGHEIDYLIETPNGVAPVEIKSSETIRPGLFEGLTYWSNLTGAPAGGGLSHLRWEGKTGPEERPCSGLGVDEGITGALNIPASHRLRTTHSCVRMTLQLDSPRNRIRASTPHTNNMKRERSLGLTPYCRR